MRYIDISIIEEKSKKIKWTVALRNKYTHLNFLVYQDDGKDYINWNLIEEFHLKNLDVLNSDERKKYINNHTDWNILIPILIKEYGNKCWYSESNLDKSVIDHFRPKSKAVNFCLDHKDTNHKFIIKQNGYWRLAYNLKNFRLSSHTSNIRFTDLESAEIDMGGKSCYFPLKFENNKFIIADDNDENPDISEKILLLDPIKPADSGYITFDKNGEPIVCGYREDQQTKAKISINLYNLANTTNFVQERQKHWMFIESLIIETEKYVNNLHKTDEEKQREEDRCFEIIRRSIDKKSCFSSVALACFETHKINPKFQFLNSFTL